MTLSAIWVLHARTQQKTGQLLVAADLADSEMSRVLTLGYSAVTPSTTSFEQVWEVRGQIIKHAFNCEVEVQSFPLLQLKFIRVIVEYSDGSPTAEPGRYAVDSFLVKPD